MIQRSASSLAHFVALARTSPLGTSDAVMGDDTDKTAQRPVTRVEPWGLRGRPATDGVRGLVVSALAGAMNGVLVGVSTDTRYGAQNLDVGEMALYSLVNALGVYLDNSGNTKITSATPSGGSQGDVIVNGGALQVARKTDPITQGTIGFVIVTGTGGAITSLQITYTPGDSSAVQTFTLALGTLTGTLTLHENINGGAAHFKA
jgi:hypothetical protein